jgi:hypothetical protein
MAFPVSDDETPATVLSSVGTSDASSDDGDEPTPSPTTPARPALKRIK